MKTYTEKPKSVADQVVDEFDFSLDCETQAVNFSSAQNSCSQLIPTISNDNWKKYIPFFFKSTPFKFSFASRYMDLDVISDVVAHTVEALIIFYYQVFTAKTLAAKMIAIASLDKMMRQRLSVEFMGIAAICHALEHYLQKSIKEDFEVQGLEEVLDSVDSFLDKFELMRKAPVFNQMYQFGMYFLAMSLYTPFGCHVDIEKFTGVSEAILKKEYHMGPDLIHCLLKTASFLTRRGFQCYNESSIMPMFHSESKYQNWYDKASTLIRQSNFLSNPSVHGINRFSYLADLKDCIEKGHCMRKCVLSKDEKVIITRLLASLEYTHDMEFTKRAAQQDRPAPASFLLFGGSGIGKSTLQNIMFHHYGKMRKLDTGSEFRYVRNPTEEFWSGFNSTMWCIIMDDIAFLSPSLKTLDPSMAEVLSVVNNVPFVPAQADLADKGRTPVLAELVLGSTNTEHLNAVSMFSCPLAAQRRFPWVIEINVRPEFQSSIRKGMLDGTKAPLVPEGEYPDLWSFIIKKVVPAGEKKLNQMANIEIHSRCANMREFLKWYSEAIKEHLCNQSRVNQSNASMASVTLCCYCDQPEKWCTCLQTQAESSEEEVDIEIPHRPSQLTYNEVEPISLAEYAGTWPCEIRFVLGYYYLLHAINTWFILKPLNGIFYCLYGEAWFAYFVLCSPHRMLLMRVFIGYAGKCVGAKYINWKNMAVMASATAACLALYLKYKPVLKHMMTHSSTYTDSSEAMSPKPEPIIRKTRSYETPYPFSSNDLSEHSKAFQRAHEDKLVSKVLSATYHFIFHQGNSHRSTGAFCIKGNVFICNNHSVFQGDGMTLDIISADNHFSTSQKGIKVTASMIYRIPSKDLALIRLRCRPPGPDMIPYFLKADSVGKIDGQYFGRDVEGIPWCIRVKNLEKSSPITWKTPQCMVTNQMWLGTSDNVTKRGDCGAILLSFFNDNPVLLGIHTLGRGNTVGVLPLDRDLLQECCDKIDPNIIVSGTINISAPSAKRIIGDLDTQSFIYQAKEGTAQILGAFEGEWCPRNKSRVGPTLIAEAAIERGYSVTRTAPSLSKASWINAINELTHPITKLDEDILTLAMNDFIGDTQQDSYPEIHVLPLRDAINGAPGVSYCDKLNRHTSAGAPYKRSKKEFMFFIGQGTDMDVTDEIKLEIQKIKEKYFKGERAHPIFVAHQKDEPISFAKRDSHSTRVFTASGIAFTLLVRMYFLTVIMHMQRNRLVYETGPGIVAQSLEWNELIHYLSPPKFRNIVAGDYKFFDKHMPAVIILYSFFILIRMCEKAGFSEKSIRILYGVAYDIAFATVEMHGVLMMFFGGNPSGHPLTVIINGIANCLYMRYCFLSLRPVGNTKSFKHYVRLMTYGDDNIMGVSDDAPWFNHTAIQKVLADVGIVYTMADKTAESVPFIAMSNANFLKRSWRFDEDLKCYVAPLEHDSISKMLTICVRSKNVSPQAHAIAVIATAVREYFWYGRDIFEKKKNMLYDIVDQCNLSEYVEISTFPTWEELREDFFTNSYHVSRDLSHLKIGMITTCKNVIDYGGVTSPVIEKENVTNPNNEELDCRIRATCGMQEASSGVMAVPSHVCIHTGKIGCHQCFADEAETQADVSVTSSPEGAHLEKGIVTFHDEAIGMNSGLNLGYDGISAMDQTERVELERFLSRPVRISTFTWNESDAVGTTVTLNPWNLFFTDARVQYKLNNYAFIQAKLKIKVLVNASPFYYGAMLMAYQPLPSFCPSTIQNDSGTRYFIPTSQRPHLWIYPQGNEGGEMTLPYFNPKNWINAQSASDMTAMGQLSFINYTTLQSANGATGTGVTISVYAYAEDVRLSGPSVGLATQCDEWETQADEYGNGAISGPASAISNAATWFEDIPIIGRFATATRIGASAVSAVAKLFGFTNVPVIADAMPMRPEPFPKLASTEIGYPVEKLTLDPKNELSVDPSIIGLDSKDEMVISHLSSRESYLTTTTWSSASASDTILFSSNVNPFLYDNDGATNSKLYMTPMGWIASLFQHWRGDIIFRFRVVASPFHKGRLRISFDPSGYSATNIINTAASNNVVFTEIVDLGDNADVEFRVPYQQATAFLITRNNYSAGSIQWSTSASPTFGYSKDRDNGTITVRVLTALTAPIASSSVSILVFVRAAENFEVANPRTVPDASTFQVQSSEFTESDYTTTQILGSGKRDPHADRYLVNFGESVKSLRQLMRRSSLVGVTTFTTDTTNDLVLNSKRFTKIPPDYGYDPGGLHSAKGLVVTGSNFPFNYVNKTPMNWIMPAFIGYRGSTIWTFNCLNKSEASHIRVWRSNQSGVAISESTAGTTKGTVSANARWYKVNTDSGAAGQALTNQWTNAGLSVSCPNYGRLRFQSTSLTNASVPGSQDDSQFDEFVLEVSSDGVSGPDNKGMKIFSYSSIGTDFGLYFFLNVPTLWLYASVPTAN